MNKKKVLGYGNVNKDGLSNFELISLQRFCEYMPESVFTNCLSCKTEDFIEYLKQIGYFKAPASSMYHGAYVGGLVDHSFIVMRELVRLTERLWLNWNRPESPYIIGMFHDLCKSDEYEAHIEYDGNDRRTINTMFIKKDPDTLPLTGHGDKSIKLLEDYIKLTNEEWACIRYHMGAFYPYEMNDYGNAIEHYENVLWTHTADIYATRVWGV